MDDLDELELEELSGLLLVRLRDALDDEDLTDHLDRVDEAILEGDSVERDLPGISADVFEELVDADVPLSAVLAYLVGLVLLAFEPYRDEVDWVTLFGHMDGYREANLVDRWVVLLEEADPMGDALADVLSRLEGGLPAFRELHGELMHMGVVEYGNERGDALAEAVDEALDRVRRVLAS